MAIYNLEYINEFLFKKKPQKEYHHLNMNEIKQCIQIAKESLKEFPKLKKCCSFINLNEKDDEDKTPLQYYFESSGSSKLVIIDGDLWDGYPNLRADGVWEIYQEDENKFLKSAQEKIDQKSIKAEIFPTGLADWDGVEFAIKSLKEK